MPLPVVSNKQSSRKKPSDKSRRRLSNSASIKRSNKDRGVGDVSFQGDLGSPSYLETHVFFEKIP